jgi:hypothetical protein
MPTKVDEQLAKMIQSLSKHIALLRKRGWRESVQLLEIAKLDLQLRVHVISDRELRSLCTALGSRAVPTSTAALKRLLDQAGDAAPTADTAASRRPSSRPAPIAGAHVRRARGARREAR